MRIRIITNYFYIDLILAVRKYDNDWPKALAETLPQRKKNKEVGRKVKEKRKEEEKDQEENE